MFVMFDFLESNNYWAIHGGVLLNENGKIYKRKFWSEEYPHLLHPSFRLEKIGQIVNSMATNGRIYRLLDVGCGPARLSNLLKKNINYFGIDIAIHDPATNLLELDILENEINFGDMQFDMIVASGLFEYMAGSQRQKFYEIGKIMKESGKFIVTFGNLKWYQGNIPAYWNNIMPIEKFKADLREYFHIDRFFACSHFRNGYGSTRKFTRYINMNLNVYIPLISPRLTQDYFIICSKKG